MLLYISSKSTLKALGYIDTEAGLCIMARAALGRKGVEALRPGQGGEIARMREVVYGSVLCMCVFWKGGWGGVCP